jgi:tripartite-type tricarboxylate transporter receptor subunit TctC
MSAFKSLEAAMKAKPWFWTLLLSSLSVVAAVHPAGAAGCPKATRIVVPYPPGSPDDVIARVLAAKLSESGDRFFVENIPGATGAIGTSAVVKARKDGCTLLIANLNLVVQPSVNPKVSYDIRTGLTAVTMLATAPEAIAVNPSLSANSMQELVALLRQAPGKYSYASPGYGSSPHLAAERLFRVTLGLDVLHVPFQGGPPVITSTVGGHTHIVHLTLPIIAPVVRDGKLRMLAVADARRLAEFPDVPTLAEAGYPGLELGYWNGMLVPNGTPSGVVQSLSERVSRTMAMPDVVERLRELGFQPNTTSPDQFSKFLLAELDRWSTIARQAKIRGE